MGLFVYFIYLRFVVVLAIGVNMLDRMIYRDIDNIVLYIKFNKNNSNSIKISQI